MMLVWYEYNIISSPKLVAWPYLDYIVPVLYSTWYEKRRVAAHWTRWFCRWTGLNCMKKKNEKKNEKRYHSQSIASLTLQSSSGIVGFFFWLLSFVSANDDYGMQLTLVLLNIDKHAATRRCSSCNQAKRIFYQVIRSSHRHARVSLCAAKTCAECTLGRHRWMAPRSSPPISGLVWGRRNSWLSCKIAQYICFCEFASGSRDSTLPGVSLFFLHFTYLPPLWCCTVDRLSLSREAEGWLKYGIPGPLRNVAWAVIGKMGIFLYSASWVYRPFRLILQLKFQNAVAYEYWRE